MSVIWLLEKKSRRKIIAVLEFVVCFPTKKSWSLKNLRNWLGPAFTAAGMMSTQPAAKSLGEKSTNAAEVMQTARQCVESPRLFLEYFFSVECKSWGNRN